MKQQKVSIGEAAKLLGVSDQTLRNWERKGLIDVERTPSGHRRYSLNQLLQQKGNNKQDDNMLFMQGFRLKNKQMQVISNDKKID